jgi:hypothetical protein
VALSIDSTACNSFATAVGARNGGLYGAPVMCIGGDLFDVVALSSPRMPRGDAHRRRTRTTFSRRGGQESQSPQTQLRSSLPDPPNDPERCSGLTRRRRAHCFSRFDVIFTLGLTEPADTRRALQPSALSECGKINSRWGIPSTRAIAGAEFQSDILVAIGYPQQRTCNRIWLRGSQWSRNTHPW